MRPAILAITLGILAAASCARSAPRDAMTLPAACDSAPPPVAPAARRAARVPHVAAGDGRGAIVGTVVEAGTGQPLWYGEAWLRPIGTGAAAALGPARADSLGGFALERVAPGTYTLHVRAFTHRATAQQVEVRAGAVDTVRAALRYHACRGY